MNIYTLSYLDLETNQYNSFIFKEINDNTAREYALNTMLKDKVYSLATLEHGETQRFKRVYRTCGVGKQIMLVRWVVQYECLDCIKYRALKN